MAAVIRRPGRWWWPAALAGLALSGGLGFWVWRSAAPATAVPAAALGATPGPRSSVHIVVRATPQEASIEIDGRDRGPAPVSFDVAPDALDHVVRAAAAGFASKVETRKFSRDLELEMSLDRLPLAKASPAPGSAPAAMSAAHAAPQRIPVPGRPKPSAAVEEPNCSPPYYFSNGIKLFKPDCI